MNKDLDSRILSKQEYRDAVNIQVSRSEGSDVGAVENVLGNRLVSSFSNLTGVADLFCIGYFSDETSRKIYLFFTNYLDTNPLNYNYNSTASNFICSYDCDNEVGKVLVSGKFLNFSKSNPIYGVNLLENLLFFTDNRNQPRVINVEEADQDSSFYTNEDQISVAKYYPCQNMELYQESLLGGNNTFETTMYDVSSKFYPNGGSCLTNGAVTASNTFPIDNIKGLILTGAAITVSDSSGTPITGLTVTAYTAPNLTVSSAVTLGDNAEIIFNENPYYDPSFSGDSDYLQDKFARFSYRFKYIDNEYSLMAPFTQIAFIPEQDGYFLYNVADPSDGVTLEGDVDDDESTYRSTIVEFMENKINQIFLRIPLPYSKLTIKNDLKLSSVEILYKESNQVAVKVVEEIQIDTISNTYATCNLTSGVTASTSLVVDTVVGNIKVGEIVTGIDVVYGTKVVSYDATTSTLVVDKNQTLLANTDLTIGEEKIFAYTYKSKKPFKTLPESEVVRVYDKVPVRSLSQEIISNRVVYGNFQNKHTPPNFLDYNVAASPKTSFSLNRRETSTSGGTQSGTTISLSTAAPAVIPQVGDFITIISGTGTIPPGTQVISVNAPDPALSISVTLSNSVTNIAASDLLLFQPGGDTINTTSIIEYPNHSLKENRSYQVGVVLSDRYGRSSSVILSNNESIINIGLQEFIGSTIYSPYRDASTEPSQWPGDSLKVIFNSPISPVAPNHNILAPGVYNGDIDSSEYNPLGWYSFKIVVKQTQQEYYNAYLPGIMAAYPQEDLNGSAGDTVELGKTSHVVLINDNINKIPRDLSELGPEQRQFRSSIKLFGRVENIAGGTGDDNVQFYPGREYQVVSSISNMRDLFEPGNINTNQISPITTTPLAEVVPYLYDQGFEQFYLNDSNPLIARLSTDSQFGVIHSSNDVINLAVLETSPVESLLDIFYETSTSGLVSDLNNAVLDESGGSATLNGFNTSSWDEGDPPGTNITNAPGFNFLNNQGSNMDPTLIEGVELISVFDQTGSDENRSSEFALSYNTATGFANIATAARFSYNEDSLERNFTFAIKVTMTSGEQVDFVQSNVLLGNQVPEIIECVPTAQNFSVDTSNQLITTFTGKNGSDYFNVLAERYKAGADLAWSIVSITRTSGEIQDGVDDSFSLDTPGLPFIELVNTIVPESGSQISTAELQKTEVMLGTFDITIKLEDANGNVQAGSDSVTCSFSVNIESAGENFATYSRWRAFGKTPTSSTWLSDKNFGTMVDGITTCKQTTVFRPDDVETIWEIDSLAVIQSNNNLFYGTGPGQYAEQNADGSDNETGQEIVQETIDTYTLDGVNYPLQGTECKFFAKDPVTQKFTKLIACGVVIYNNLSGEIKTRITTANLEREPNNDIYESYTVNAGEEVRFVSGRMFVAYYNNSFNFPCVPSNLTPIEFPPGSGRTQFTGYNVCSFTVPWGTMYEIATPCPGVGGPFPDQCTTEQQAAWTSTPSNGNFPGGGNGNEFLIKSTGFNNHGQGYTTGPAELYSTITEQGVTYTNIKVGEAQIDRVTSSGEVMKFIITDLYITQGATNSGGVSADGSAQYNPIQIKQPSSSTPVFCEINVNAPTTAQGLELAPLCAYITNANFQGCRTESVNCPNYENNTVHHNSAFSPEIGTTTGLTGWC